ncbi:hypothetical protein CKF54_03920 [Psittacicella hinzii]|uniref:Antitoxin SocA-like Panacea domain-containing protein n=1 Tax=Psittacicella hinzii TaxID=2028575 RepID=A0A3A1Y6K8_9GAMM|nr:type II toxin-antitoxin system antitoxin SocA domain-containing protein [Psittacicella hinzii]RIY32848.1 hypothetical protein CKF54_03920 [Psittacicella hinzii]
MNLYSVASIANHFIEISLKRPDKLPNLTVMKLQRLLFFAQAWHIQKYTNILFADAFVRWQYGPVIPYLYYELK